MPGSSVQQNGSGVIKFEGPQAREVQITGWSEDHQAFTFERNEGFGCVQVTFNVLENRFALKRMQEAEHAIVLEPMTTSYFLSRATVVPTPGSGMMWWREKLYANMHRNAASAVEFLNLPTNRVVELGTMVQI